VIYIPENLFLRPHHRCALETLAARYQNSPEILSVVVGGSIARERARDDSDVDAILVVTAEEYQRRQRENSLAFCDWEIFKGVADYSGGYLDAKFVDEAFLRDAAQCGSEPTRNSFVAAFPLFSDLEDLQALLERIGRYPEELRQERIESFWAQLVFLRHYFWGCAERANDHYLKARCVADVALYAGRMILAWNRILFPSQKGLMQAVSQAPEKPADLIAKMEALLQSPSREHLDALCQCVEDFADWQIKGDSYTRFIEDTEIAWRSGKIALSEC
jgi:hypothetical protein